MSPAISRFIFSPIRAEAGSGSSPTREETRHFGGGWQGALLPKREQNDGCANATRPELVIGKPRMLFEGDFDNEFDVTADGQRFRDGS